MKSYKTILVILSALFSFFPTILSAQMTWNCVCSSASWSRSCHTSVVFDNKMWLIGGFCTFGDTNDVWYSTDGANWTCVTQAAPWLTREGHTSVVFNNKMWVIGGAHWDGIRYTYLNDVWSSTDGANWTQVTASAQWSIRTYHTSVVYDGKMWVIGGEDALGFFTDVWYSTDGDSWALATEYAGWLGRVCHTSVVFDNKIWVLGGAYWTGNRWFFLNDIWHSTDGINWTCITESAPWSPRGCHSSVVFNNDLWVIGGTISHPDPSLRVNDVWCGEMLADSSADWAPRGWHTSVVYDNRIWVIGGDSTENFYTMCDVWYSTGLGIEEENSKVKMQKAKLFEVYPNPAKSFLAVRLPQTASRQEIKIFDVTGKTVKEIEILRSTQNDGIGETKISLNGMNPGLYFVRVGTETKKFLVVK